MAIPSFTLQMTLGQLQASSDFFDYTETQEMEEAVLSVRYERATDRLYQDGKIDTYHVSETNPAFLAELYRLSLI